MPTYFESSEYFQSLLRKVQASELAPQISVSLPAVTQPLTPSEQIFLHRHTLLDISPPQPVTLNFALELIGDATVALSTHVINQALNSKGLERPEVKAAFEKAEPFLSQEPLQTAATNEQANSAFVDSPQPGFQQRKQPEVMQSSSLTSLESQQATNSNHFLEKNSEKFGAINPNEIKSTAKNFATGMVEGFCCIS